MKDSTRLLKFILIAMFVAIELAIGLIPNVGYIRINPAMAITIMHIPVILAGVLFGWKSGAVIGFFFGLTSLINATFLMPSPIESPLYSPFYQGGVFSGNGWSLVICFVPRILVGIVAALAYRGFDRISRMPKIASLAVAGVLASLTNTVLVLGGVFLFFREPYAAANNISVTALWNIIMGIISLNGLIEAGVAGLLTALVGRALLQVTKKLKI